MNSPAADKMLDKLASLHSVALRTWNIYLSENSYLQIKVFKYPHKYMATWENGVRKEFDDPFELLEYLTEHVVGAAKVLAEPIDGG